MKLYDIEENEENINCDSISPKKDNWTGPTYDIKQENGFNELDDLTKGSNLAKLAMTMKAFEFADNTTMHGLRYVFMRNISQARRLVWLFVVLGGTGYCTYLFYQTLNSYLEHPTVTKISSIFEKQSEFPAITVCNYNVLIKSKLTPKEQSVVAHVYANSPLPQNMTLEDFDYINVEEFFKEKGFDYRTDFCFHKERACSPDLFQLHVTDFGTCITFDPGRDEKSKYQVTPGSSGGFYIGQVFNRTEWTFGPHYHSEGFRVLIHQPGTNPYRLLANGISVIPEFISDIVIARRESNILPPPHGECGSTDLDYFVDYTNEKCMLECETKYMVNKCGCKHAFFPGPAPVCTFSQSHKCSFQMSSFYNGSGGFDASACVCPKDCFIVKYSYHLTNTKPAVGYYDLVQQIYNLDVSQASGLKIYYQDLIYYKEVEEPVYTVEKLLCDIGGATGLFLGCSFVTFFEFFDFIVEFVWFLGKRGAIFKRKGEENDAIV